MTFLHAGGLYQESHPKNAGSYFGSIDEAQYVAGIVAGSTSKTGKLGFVAAKPIPQVLRNINAFTLGARKVKPKATTRVVFTGDWALPVKEAEATNGLIDQGADVVTMHVDSPKVIERPSGAGCIRVAITPTNPRSPPQGLSHRRRVELAQDLRRLCELDPRGKPWPNLLRGGLKEGSVKISTYGPAVGDEARKHADTTLAQFMAGEMVIYKGELKDNTGKVVVPAGKEIPQTDYGLERMDYLVEGMIGSTR